MGSSLVYEDGFSKRYALDARGKEVLLVEPGERELRR